MEHLSPSARVMLSHSDEERINYVQKRKWFAYERAEAILRDMDALLRHPQTDRMPNMILTGETNNGKTTLARQFMKLHPGHEEEGDSRKGVRLPAFYVQMPHSPSEGEFYDAILSRLATGQYRPNQRSSYKKQLVLDLMREYRVGMLLLDEVQHVLAGNLNKQRNFLNLIKYLANELRIPIVGMGTPESLQAVSADPQMANRFEPRFLLKWNMGEDYLRLLSAFEKTLPLRKPSGLIQMALAEKILTLSEGKIGEMHGLLIRAFRFALKSEDEKITEKSLMSVHWILPSKRGRYE